MGFDFTFRKIAAVVLFLSTLVLSAWWSTSEVFRSARVPADDLEKEAGRLIMSGWNGGNFDQLLKDTSAGHVGAVVVFAGAFKDLPDLQEKISRLRAGAPWPIVFAMDAEGGKIMRFARGLQIPPTPTARQLGLRGDAAALETANVIAVGLRRAGINLNLAPVVDLLLQPSSAAIGLLERAYSQDPVVVTARAKQFVRGHRQAGVGATLKHFPGLGSAKRDTHAEPVDVTATFQEFEWQPYREIFADGFDGAVMTAHLDHKRWDPVLPASLSPSVIQGILRKKLGFDGPVITDDLQMQAIASRYSQSESIRLALLAGNDWLMFTQQHRPDPPAQVHQRINALLRSGRVPKESVRRSLARIQKFTDVWVRH